MKNFFVVVPVILSVAGCLSMEPKPRLTEEDRIVTQVIEAPGHTQAQIYGAAVMWAVEKFESAKHLDYENRQDGTFIVKAVLRNVCMTRYQELSRKCNWAPMTLRFEARDERFKLTYTDIRIDGPIGNTDRFGSRPLQYQEDLDIVKPGLLRNGSELLSRIKRGSNSSDW